jgi:hypothetical protein
MKLKTTLPWVEIKKRLTEKSDKELLSIISSCYKASDEVKFYLTSIVVDDEEADEILMELKERLSNTFWDTAKNGRPLGPNLKEARNILSDVKKVTNNPETIINFMLDYVEHGVDFTNKYGDMWDGYYSSIESMFESLENCLTKNIDKINIAVTMTRIEDIVNKSNGIGWGFHDNLLDMYVGLKFTIKELKE